MREIEKLNAIATMTIRKYQMKNHRLKVFITGLILIYIMTILGFLIYINLSRQEIAFAVASPLCMTVARTQAKTKRAVFV